MTLKEILGKIRTKDSPQKWWGNPKNAEVWLELVREREETGDPNLNHTIQQVDIVLNQIDKDGKGLQSILEVGAGNGRLIGNISRKYRDKECSSVDINVELSRYVSGKYPEVRTYVSDVTKLPFKDNSFDLVFTFQVLQHVPPENIRDALIEINRVAKKEFWLWEGRKGGCGHKAKTHGAHGGSFVYYFETMVGSCYDVSIPQNENITLRGMRLYKMHKMK